MIHTHGFEILEFLPGGIRKCAVVDLKIFRTLTRSSSSGAHAIDHAFEVFGGHPAWIPSAAVLDDALKSFSDETAENDRRMRLLNRVRTAVRLPGPKEIPRGPGRIFGPARLQYL